MYDHSRGDVAEVEGRLAVLIREGKSRGRWDWMDGTWTTIPMGVGPVLFNIYDQTAAITTPPGRSGTADPEART